MPGSVVQVPLLQSRPVGESVGRALGVVHHHLDFEDLRCHGNMPGIAVGSVSDHVMVELLFFRSVILRAERVP